LIFQYPPAFSLLLLIPILILLHNIRTRRREATVSSLFLWEQVLKESSRRFRLKKILRNLSLLLQILATLLLVAALAQPAYLKSSAEKKNVVILLDTSASMKSGGARSRMDDAKRMILDALAELGEESRVLLIEAGPLPSLVLPFTQDRDKIRRSIRDTDATDAPGSMREALLMALSLTDGERGDEIWIASDGAFDPFEESALSGTQLRWLAVGSTERNIGITQFEFRSRLNDPGEYEILVAVNNYTEQPVSVPLDLQIDGTPYLSASVSLEPFSEIRLIYAYRGLVAETATVAITANDDFETDDRAFAVLSQSRGVEILLITQGNPFLEAVLAVYPNARLDKNQPQKDYSDYDMVVFDRVSPPPLVAGNYLLVDAMAAELPLQTLGVLDRPQIDVWSTEHPVLDALSLKGIRIQQAAEVALQGDGQVLASSGDSPLMVAYESRRLRALYLAFDLMQSDLPLKTAFPLLMGNILRWFYPGSLTSSTRQVKAGSEYPIVPKGFKFDVRKPDGTVDTIAPLESPYLYEGTDTVGIYTVRGTDLEESFAVNLTDRGESDIRPRFFIEEPQEKPPAPEVTSQSRRSFAFLFLLVCLAILMVEWLYWVKKW
jgi:hypothetical protein